MIEEIFNEKWINAKTPIERREVIKNKIGFIPTVVYLDDEVELLKLFEKQIFSLGLDTFVSHDPHEALLYLEANSDKIGCIFSDYKMPEMNGLEFRKKIIDKNLNASFFLLSSYIDSEAILKSVGLKVSGFFDKPFSVDRIIEYFQRKNISSDVLMESDSFLEKNEDFSIFWKNAFQKAYIDIFLMSSEYSSPIKAELLDFSEDTICLNFKDKYKENTKDVFIKFIIQLNNQEKKLLFPAQLIESGTIKGEDGVVSQSIEFKLNGIKQEDIDFIHKVAQERQSIATQYLMSVQKQKK